MLAFGERIKKLRQDKGWSQYEASYKSNLDRSYIKKIEKGESNIWMAVLPELAELFEISISELLNFDYPSNNDNEEPIVFK